VQTAATAALRRLANDGLVSFILDQLPSRAIAVRRYQFAELKETWRLTTPSLLRRITRSARPASLEVWINLAEMIGSAELLERVVTMHDHESPLVRIATAKALKRYYHPDSVAALVKLLADGDWRVRGQAARALGTIGAVGSVDALGLALRDRSWWVRFRAALALAQLGEVGRRVLRDARATGDRFASEMATMISGLSEGGIVELAEG
jgi:HEAT repeat protein